jgi:putative FmdB family regulatory protein
MSMPTYEYHCDACAHTFDEFQYITEAPLKKCPECGKKKLRRAFGMGAAVLFKGSGFYETDYRSDAYKQAARADKESAGSATGADSKPADTSSTADTSGPATKGSGSKKEKKSSKSKT